MKEKKILWNVVMIISLFLCGGGISNAAISGVCSNCHTMHNSQDGAGEVETYSSGTLTTGGTTPQDQLLKASCIACHTGTSGATNSHDAPIVLHTVNPGGQGAGKTLAGGDFYWVADGLGNLGDADSKGHNVAGISGRDESIEDYYTPPGFDSGATPGALSDGTIGSSWNSTNQLTCAGTYGCHGNHTDDDADSAISGAHHGNTNGTSTRAENPTTVGSSYRFLGGINGLEYSEWNWDETSVKHNEYYGVNGNATYTDQRTISYSCAQCHGNFHKDAGTGTSSPWIRHPTDIVLPTTADKEYQYYNPDGGNLYSVEAPVARGIVPTTGSGSTVTIGGTGADGAIVMCLSCHRAHGSPEPDILRWAYNGMTAGIGENDTGCFTCHTTKNAD